MRACSRSRPKLNSETLNLLLFVYAIAKFLALTGLGLAGVIVVIAECCGFRFVALGVEKVRGDRTLSRSNRDGQLAVRVLTATSPSRKVSAA